MEADRHPEVLRGRPKAVVGTIAIGTFGGRLAPDHRAFETLFGRALHLARCLFGIVQRDERNAGEPLAIMCAIVGEPIVVCGETRSAQSAVFELEQLHPEARVEHLAHVSFLLLRLDPRSTLFPYASHTIA